MSLLSSPRRFPHRAQNALLGAGLTLLMGALSACGTAPVTVYPAPHASAAVCAQVLQRLPQETEGLNRRGVTAQAAAAWGGREAVVLRCGTTELPPTAAACFTLGAGDFAVDWVNRTPEPEDLPNHTYYATYGLNPAVEVSFPSDLSVDPMAVLTQLTDALQVLDRTGSRCL